MFQKIASIKVSYLMVLCCKRAVPGWKASYVFLAEFILILTGICPSCITNIIIGCVKQSVAVLFQVITVPLIDSSGCLVMRLVLILPKAGLIAVVELSGTFPLSIGNFRN